MVSLFKHGVEQILSCVDELGLTLDLCVCAVLEMGASDSGDRSHDRAASSTVGWSRANGWSWPPHPFQLIAWAVLIYIALFFYLTTVPALVVDVQIACYVVSLLRNFCHQQTRVPWISHGFVCVILDPAWGRGTPFRLCSSLVHSLPHVLLFITFSLFPFLIYFTYFLLLSI